MSLVRLGIHRDYCPKWGVWEGVRDLVQNALDEADKGHELEVSIWSKSERIRIINYGSTLPPEALLIGYSTKADDDTQRGQYGEGLKLAMLALLRNEIDVTIYSGGKSYKPRIVTDPKLGADTLAIKVGKSSVTDCTEVRIEGISAKEWRTEFEPRFMKWAEWEDVVDTSSGTLIRDPEAKGMIYVKGIYACKMDDLEYGFDLRYCDLNRDRDIPRQWDLEYHTGQVLAKAVYAGDVNADAIIDAFESSSPASRQLSSYHSEAAKAVADRLKEKHPDADAFAFSQEEMDAVGHKLEKVVRLPAKMRDFLGGSLPTVEKALSEKESEPTKFYDLMDLTDKESDGVAEATGVLDFAVDVPVHVLIVDCAVPVQVEVNKQDFSSFHDITWLVSRAVIKDEPDGLSVSARLIAACLSVARDAGVKMDEIACWKAAMRENAEVRAERDALKAEVTEKRIVATAIADGLDLLEVQ